MTNLVGQNSLVSLDNNNTAGADGDRELSNKKGEHKSADKSIESSPNKVLLLSSKKNLDHSPTGSIAEPPVQTLGSPEA